jgi:drug/metabolite transporter (DMT)-like permease
MLLYPACFAVFFLISQILLIMALNEGPTSLTNIINSFQSIVPIIVSFVLWKENMGVFQIIGLVLFVIVLFLFNKGATHSEKSKDKKISLKWVLLALISTLFIGTAVIFTKQHMLTFNGFVKEFLILYNLVIIVLELPYIIILKLKGSSTLPSSGRFIFYAFLPALLTNITNMIYMINITKFKSVLFFPLISILNIVSVTLFSRVFFKEKVSKTASFGIVLSFAAIYLLGIK